MRSVSVTACWHVLTSNSFSMPVCRYPMSGWHLTMVSPSNSSSRRSTPCVEGCCGPMFRDRLRGFAPEASTAADSGMGVATVSLTFVPASNPIARDALPISSTAADSGMGVATVSLTFVPASNPIARDAVILAQRMPFPIVRQHDAAQIRMVPEPHAEQIECFPLELVRAAPHFRHGIDLRIAARQAALQAQPLVPVERVQMINDFEARLGRIQVHAGNCAQAHKTQVVLQKPANAHDFLARYFDSQLAPVELAAHHRAGVERF